MLSYFKKRADITTNYDFNDTTLVFGIDWTEKHRAGPIEQRWDPYPCLFPLFDNFDKNQFMESMEKDLKIRRPRLYTLGFSHNNCGGFCIKAGKAQFLLLLDKMPDRFKYHEDKEQSMQAYLGKPYTILREVKVIKDYNKALLFTEEVNGSLKYWDTDTKKFLKVGSEESVGESVKNSIKFQVSRYLSLKELRIRSEEIKKTEEGQEDWGGCGCFA